MAEETTGAGQLMYGVVTQMSKTIINGRVLPGFCFRVNPDTGKVTLNRIAALFVFIYSRLPEKPRHPSEIWHDTRAHTDFASKVNIHAKQNT